MNLFLEKKKLNIKKDLLFYKYFDDNAYYLQYYYIILYYIIYLNIIHTKIYCNNSHNEIKIERRRKKSKDYIIFF